MSSRRRFVRIDDDSHKILNEMSAELTGIEKRQVKNGEVIERTLKSEEIRERLRIGAKNRRGG